MWRPPPNTWYATCPSGPLTYCVRGCMAGELDSSRPFPRVHVPECAESDDDEVAVALSAPGVNRTPDLRFEA